MHRERGDRRRRRGRARRAAARAWAALPSVATPARGPGRGRRALAERRRRPPERAGRRQRRGPARGPATRRLSSAGVPSATTRPPSMTAMRSARRSASSRYWVVRKTVTPPPTSSPITSHIALRLRGSRPVVGSSRKSTAGARRGWRPGRAAGACRRSTSRPAGAGVDEVEAREQLAGAGACLAREQAGSRPIMRRFSSPVCSSSTAAYWPVRLIARRTRRRPATTSRPATRPVPPSGRDERGQDPDGRRLARAVGPEQREDAAAATRRSTPSSTRTSP